MDGRKTIKQVAVEIKQEERMQKMLHESAKFVYDEYSTLAFFKRMCIKVGNLKNREIEALICELKKRDEMAIIRHQKGDVFCFDKQIMYDVLNTNSICHGICVRNKYETWQDLVNRFFLS